MKKFILPVLLLLVLHGKAQQPETNQPVVFVERSDNEMVFTWKTSREVNSTYFVLERSTDGKHFEAVGSFRAAGNSTFPKNYTYAMPEDSTGCYYRVVLVNMEGHRVVSHQVSPYQRCTAVAEHQ